MAPLRPETSWRIDGDDLMETTGRRERRLPLASLRLMLITPPGAGKRRAATLLFAQGRTVVPSHSLAGPGRFEDRTDSFGELLRSVAARAHASAPAFRVRSAAIEARGVLTWSVLLLAAGVIALLGFSLSAGAASLGVSLAARLVFVLILVFAVTPWMARPSPPLDPDNLPRSLLP